MAKRIAALLLVMSLMLACYAVASTYGYGSNNTISPEDIKFGQTDQELGGIWISQIQFRLNDYGYFEGENFNPGELDSATGRALQRYCSVIGVNLDSENMLTRGLQSRILSSSALPKWPPEVTPEPSTAPTPFPIFTIGAYDPAIREIQTRLTEYFKYVNQQGTPGVLDEATIKALEAYLNQNGFSFNGTVDENIYRIIVDQDALPSPAVTPTPLPVFFISYLSSGDENIVKVQQRLEALNYLDHGQYTVGFYDAVLQNALYEFCDLNGVNVNDRGIDKTMFDAIMSESAKAKKMPIVWGVESDQVQTLQQKLADLNYYKDFNRSGNRCDEDMLKAVRRFADYNNISFDGTTISESLQDEILRSNRSWTEPAGRWATRQVSMIGISMPLYMMIILIVLILAGLTALIIRTFSKDSPKSGGTAAASGNGMKVELEVRYQGNYVGKCTSVVKMPLHIGRSYSVVPLDKRDMFIGKNHCQLSSHDNTLFLRDFSKNGTKINGVPVHNGEGVVHDNDTLSIGEHQIRVRILR